MRGSLHLWPFLLVSPSSPVWMLRLVLAAGIDSRSRVMGRKMACCQKLLSLEMGMFTIAQAENTSAAKA